MPILKTSYAERMARLRGKLTLAGRTARPLEPLDGVARTSSQTTYTDSLHGKGDYIRQSPGGPVVDPCCDQDMIIHIRTGGLTIVLPFTLVEGDRITVTWGDGSKPEDYNSSSGPITHTYESDLTDYYIHVKGDATAFGQNGGYTGNDLVIGVEQWGYLGLQSLANAFFFCVNLEYVPPTLPSSVTDTHGMFNHATMFDGDITGWDVSRVTSMKNMFTGASAFNQDLSAWNTGAVTRMESMFKNASSFNGDVSTWDVSQVTSMYGMFNNASSFAGDLSAWDTGAVTNMSIMFQNASHFNSDLNGWNVAKVEYMDGMFNAAIRFNSSLSAWNVGNVILMSDMFNTATAFQGLGGLTGWNTGKVISLYSTFASAHAFNGDVSTWNTGAVTTMQGTFFHCYAFNKDIGGWNVSKVTEMNNMFRGATSFNKNLSNWVVIAVTNMNCMFQGATAFNNNGSNGINNWDVHNVTDMRFMFYGATAFNQPIGNWNVGNSTNFMYAMLAYASNFQQVLYNWHINWVAGSANGLLYGTRPDMFNNAGGGYWPHYLAYTHDFQAHPDAPPA